MNVLYILSLILVDLFLYYLSLFIGYYVREFLDGYFNLPEFNISMRFLILQIWIPIIIILTFLYNGLYTKRRDYWEDLAYILKSFALSVILIFSVISFIKFSDRLSRLHLIISFSIYLLLHSVMRYHIKVLLNKVGIGVREILIIGITDSTISISNIIQNDRYTSYHIAGFWDNTYPEEIIRLEREDLRVFKDDNIEGILKNMRINSVIVSEGYSKHIDFVTRIRKSVKNIFILSDTSSLFNYYSYLFSTLYSDTLVLSIKNNLMEPFNVITKRLFDIFISLLLLPLITPIMLIIYLLIKLDSKGPAIFKQERIGKDGKKIMIYKFRTMYMNSDEILDDYLVRNPEAKTEWEVFRKLRTKDPRITRIGNFLRKTSLDELPQIFNVLKGEMSLVGPRPVSEEEIEKYYREFSDFYYEVRPGITGLWQVSGRNETDYSRRVYLDSIYALNWSLWLDIVIIIKTVKVVLMGEGAY